MNCLLRKERAVYLFLIIFAYGTSSIAGKLQYGPCKGKRLDTLAKSQTMSASKCVSLGGTCSGLGDRSAYVDDPRTLKSTDKISSCYDSRIKLNCTGTLLRSKDNLEKDATPKKCISLKGTCCSSFGKFFDPRKSPNETYCIECYSGPVSNGSCGGKLLATIDYTAKTCTYFGGSCCDDFRGGSAFCSRSFPDPETLDCNMCYTGSPQTVG